MILKQRPENRGLMKAESPEGTCVNLGMEGCEKLRVLTHIRHIVKPSLLSEKAKFDLEEYDLRIFRELDPRINWKFCRLFHFQI